MSIIEGRNPVIEALKSGREIDRILIAKNLHGTDKIWTLARERGVSVSQTDRAKLDGMTVTNAHQGVIAVVAAHHYVSVDDILRAAEQKGEPPFIIVLDEVTDPHNLGAVIRTANAAGAHGVIIPKRRSAGLTETVVKTSAGAVEYTPVARVANLARTIDDLKRENIWFYGANRDATLSYTDADFKGGAGIIIGGEGAGIGRLIAEKCDFLVSIPMKGRIDSLNASVAAGVLMYEVVKQRRIHTVSN